MLGILVTMLIALTAAVRGPSVFDRILAINMFGTKTVLLIAVSGFLTGRPEWLDLAILYALILSEFIMAPLINRLHTRSEKTQPSPAKANHISGILVVLGTLGTLVMLMAVMVSIGVPG